MSFTPPRPEWQQALPLGPSPSPPMLSPTSVPSSSKPSTPERRPKLRASCDACAASKVKCSKEHPICARCSANGSRCIYGISRKHGKPGRTRKRNPDGTPFIKASKQRPSPDGSEFGKFRIRAEPLISDAPILPLTDFSEVDSMSSWSTPSWPGTPEFEFEMTPEPLFLEPASYPFMSDMLMANTQPLDPMTTQAQTHVMEPELTFRDPFAKRESVQLDLPDIQALKDFIGGDMVNPMDYTFEDMNAEPFLSDASTTSSNPQSPTSAPYINPLRVSISIPTSHCCYTLAYSTLESLSLNPPMTQGNGNPIELKSLDSVLSITKTAVQNVLQLLSCPCSADPHLAMLYSSIASKILTWYQIAAGINPASPPTPNPMPMLTNPISSPTSSTYSSPLSTPSSTNSTFNIQIQPLKIGLFEFDEADQEALRRQVVLRELKKCGTLVDALANWRSDSTAEQAEFLYDVLGAWLKSELYKTLRQVGGEDSA